jgi:hypothetical protein
MADRQMAGRGAGDRFRSACCAGELCSICRNPAYAKVEETIFDDDPIGIRHPLTAYVCREHFRQIMGGRGVDLLEAARRQTSGSG